MSSPAIQPDPRPVNQRACALCELPLPSNPVEGAGGQSYCCHGCAHVALILDAVGADSESGRRALEAARKNGLISSAGRKETARELPAVVREEKKMRLEGLSCPSCAWLVESVLTARDGVASAEVEFFSDTVRVVYDLRKVTEDDLVKTVVEAGYGLSELESRGGAKERRDLLRLALATFVAMNQMVLAWVGYSAFFSGRADPWALFIGWVQLLTAVPVITWAAMPVYRRALAAIAHGRIVMDTLLSLGIISAAGLSLFAVLTAQPHTYLETATMLVALSLGGRALERWLKRRASRSLTNILRFSPTKARRAEDGRFEPLDRFARGDMIEVKAGETVPLDVRVKTDVIVRESLLTGEPRPVSRRKGDRVLAGSVVERGSLVGEVEQPAGASVADAIRDRVSEALRRADAGSRLADRLAQGFVPLVILVALAALLGHLASGAQPVRAAMTAVAVLVVACPCAFGVAASSCLSLAVLRLAKTGILVKDPAALETMRGVDRVIFDKTGTLTRGDMALVQVGWTGGKREGMLAAIRALEEESRHPAGIALARLLPPGDSAGAEAVVEIPGIGITGTVNGRRVAAGKMGLFAPLPLRRPLPSPTDGSSRVWFGNAGEPPVGYADLADRLRPEAQKVISDLTALGLETELLSGDGDEPTVAAAQRAGIPKAEGDLRPEQKARRVEELRRSGHRVAFVGDGFNDAEALAAADAGVALASGAELAMVSAPFVITRGGLGGVVDLMRMSRLTVKVLRGNFAWAFAYNLALIPLAALGFLAPVYAAAMMALSSASVILNSMRVRSGDKTAKLEGD